MGALRRNILIGSVTLAVAWVLLPSLTPPANDALDVVVVADSDLATATDEIERQLRESGRSAEVVESPQPCDPDVLMPARDRASTVVLALGHDALVDCASLDAGNDLKVIAFSPTVDDTLVDGTLLVPADPGARRGCQWWEPLAPAAAVANCEPDGGITIRDDSGMLTIAGRDRVGRLIAAVAS